MADGHPPRPSAGSGEPNSPTGYDAPPPPLTDIRVKGPGARGLNKPALLIAVGGSLAAILVLVSGSLSSDPSKKPTDAKPMMSSPARPEVARGVVRNLPATYEQAALQQAAREPSSPPVLGPPLPGDVAAFSPGQRQLRGQQAEDWSAEPHDPPHEAIDPTLAEAEQAERSQLFFALRQEPNTTSDASSEAKTSLRDSMTALRQNPSDTSPSRLTSSQALFPGAVIPASLITEINSESPGPVVAQITQAVFDSATGRTLLIPQGARLIGDYKSNTRYGQARIAILWSRLIMPDGVEIALDEAAVDSAGTAGVSGQVDNHWPDVFGAATLGTLINVGVATTEPQLTHGALGVTSGNPADTAIADGVQRNASAVTNRVVDRGLAIPPTVRVEAGKRISVIVSRRLAL